MIPRDSFDDRSKGAGDRQPTKQRGTDPDRDGAARRARIAQVIALEELWHEIVQAHTKHVL